MTVRNPSAGGGGDTINNFFETFPMLFPIDGEDGEDGFPIPGARGTDGIIGANGLTTVIMLPLEEPELPDEPLMVPGPKGDTGAAGGATDPFEGSYAPGSFDVADGDYVVMGSRLILNGTESVTLNGNSVLIITH